MASNLRFFLRFFLTFILIFGLGCATLRSATKTNIDFYVKWEGLTTDQILEQGKKYLDQGGDNAVDSATVCFTIAASRLKGDLTTPEKSAQYVEALSRLGKIYLSTYYDYSKAYSNLILAQEIAETKGVSDALPSIYLNLGVLFVNNYVLTRDSNALAEGQEYLLKAFDRSYENDKTYNAITSFTNLMTLSMFYTEIGQISSTIEKFETLEVPENEKALYNNALILLKAVRFYSNKEYGQALDYFNSLLSDTVADVNAVRYRIMVNNHRIHLLDKLGRRDQAIAMLRENEELATEHGLRDVLFHTYRSLSELYHEQGNNALGDQYLIKYYKEKDSVSSNNELGNIYEMKFRYDLEKSTAALDAMKQREREQRIILWAIIAIVLVILVMFAMKLRDNRRLRQNNQMLYQKSLESLANEDTRPKYKTSALTDADKATIAERVQNVLDSNPEIYELDFNMNRLAELVDVPARSVSQVLNEVYGKNFNNIITECRIREACRRLQQPDAKSRYTIEALAESVGFKSRTNFATNFKAVTGLTPTQYIKLSTQAQA